MLEKVLAPHDGVAEAHLSLATAAFHADDRARAAGDPAGARDPSRLGTCCSLRIADRRAGFGGKRGRSARTVPQDLSERARGPPASGARAGRREALWRGTQAFRPAAGRQSGQPAADLPGRHSRPAAERCRDRGARCCGSCWNAAEPSERASPRSISGRLPKERKEYAEALAFTGRSVLAISSRPRRPGRAIDRQAGRRAGHGAQPAVGGQAVSASASSSCLPRRNCFAMRATMPRRWRCSIRCSRNSLIRPMCALRCRAAGGETGSDRCP